MTNSENQHFAILVAQIQLDDPAAMAELYATFASLRKYCRSQLGAGDGDERFQATMALLLEAVHEGRVMDPQRLAAYAMSIARHQVIDEIRRRTRMRLDEGMGCPELYSSGSVERDILIRERRGFCGPPLAG